jgi:hypothetical protein
MGWHQWQRKSVRLWRGDAMPILLFVDPARWQHEHLHGVHTGLDEAAAAMNGTAITAIAAATTIIAVAAIIRVILAMKGLEMLANIKAAIEAATSLTAALTAIVADLRRENGGLRAEAATAIAERDAAILERDTVATALAAATERLTEMQAAMADVPAIEDAATAMVVQLRAATVADGAMALEQPSAA